jgi:hypothetical protein
VTDLVRSLAVVACLLFGWAACGDDDDGRGGDAGPGAGAPEGPPGLAGEVTEVDAATAAGAAGAVLVEEQPGVERGGRKAWIDLAGVAIVGPDGEVDPRGDDPASLVGETVSVWTTICRESYPEQCDAERIVVG